MPDERCPPLRVDQLRVGQLGDRQAVQLHRRERAERNGRRIDRFRHVEIQAAQQLLEIKPAAKPLDERIEDINGRRQPDAIGRIVLRLGGTFSTQSRLRRVEPELIDQMTPPRVDQRVSHRGRSLRWKLPGAEERKLLAGDGLARIVDFRGGWPGALVFRQRSTSAKAESNASPA